MQQFIWTMKVQLEQLEELSEEVIGQCIYDEEVAQAIRDDKAQQLVDEANYGDDNYWLDIQED